MNRFSLAACLCAVIVCGIGLVNPAPARADAPLYTDDTVRFQPPPDFDAVTVPPVDLSEQPHLSPVAAYVHNRGKEDQLTILIMMVLFPSGLNDFEQIVENDLRNQIDGLFVSKKVLTRLPNGMPAYWFKFAYGEGFDSMQQYAYATIDGRRGIVVSVSGHVGIIDEDKAKDALRNLAVVLPRSF